MKKSISLIIIVLLFAVIFAGCSSSTLQVEKSNRSIEVGEEILTNLEYVSTQYPNRTAGSELSNEFINYISTYMQDIGYTVENQEFTITTTSKTSSNIVCRKEKSGAKKEYIIGCQWDNCYDLFTNTNPDGAYESGASIAALMSVSKILYNIDLSYNLTIIYFGAGVNSYYGAEYYLSKLTDVEKEKISILINYSMLGAGDNLYMYSRDIDTNYNKVFYEVANINNIPVQEVPNNKRIIDSTMSTENMYSYVHIGMFGNNYPFMNELIPTVNYLSLNWKDTSQAAFTEMSGKDNVFETADDTYQNMLNRVSKDDLKTTLNNVVKSTVYTIADNSKAINSALDNPDEVSKFVQGNAAYYVGTVVVKIIAVAVLIVLVFLAREAIKKNQDKYKDHVKVIKIEDIIKQDLGADIDPFDDEKNNSQNSKSSGGDNSSDDDVFQ